MKFRLSGINNQNFLMTDEQTGSWWQQISGKAVAGPLKGRQLTRVFHDEVAFRLWLREHPSTRVLVPSTDTAWVTFSRNWEAETDSMPVATRLRRTDSMPLRTLVLGLEIEGDTGPTIFDAGLGLDPGWAANVIRAVGNYGEIFDRNVGPDTALGLSRGVNDLWTNGGLQYAPPYR